MPRQVIHQLDGQYQRRVAQGSVDQTETYDYAQVVEVPAPVANDDSYLATISQQTIFFPLANDTGPGRIITAAGPVSDGTSTVEVINDGSSVRFTSDGNTGVVTFPYTIQTGTGTPPNGGTSTATITVTKQEPAAEGEGELELSVVNLEDEAEPTRYGPVAGFLFRAVPTGFGVEDPIRDVRVKWSFSDPGYYTRWSHEDNMRSGFWDRYYRITYGDGTTEDVTVRGPVVYLIDGETQHVTPAVPDLSASHKGYRPDFGVSQELLGFDRNVAFGPFATHVFSGPGDYVVTAEARVRGGAPVTRTITVHVEDAAMDQVFVVSNDGDFTDEPAGAIRCATYNEALQQANSGSSGKKARILLRAGQTHETSTNRPNTDFAAFQIGPFGPGDPPNYPLGFLFWSSDPQTQYAVWGINFITSYNTADPWNSGVPGWTVVEKSQIGSWFSMWDCYVSGAGSGARVQNGGENWFVGNTFMTNWNKFAVSLGQVVGNFGLAGCWFLQNQDAVVGPGESDDVAPYYVDHGAYRSGSHSKPVAFNLFECRTIGQHDNPPPNFQPNMRIGRSYAGTGLEYVMMDRVRGEHSGIWGSGQASPIGYPRRYIWDKCYTVEQNEGDMVFRISVSGFVFRNSVVIYANVPGNGPEVWVNRHWPDKHGDDDPETENYGLDIYGCNLINLRNVNMTFDLDVLTNGGVDGSGAIMRPFKHIQIGNNILRSAAGDPLDTDDGPLNTDELFKSTYPGLRFESTDVNTSYAYPDGTTGLWYPEAGSAALGAASTSHSNVGNGQGALIPVDDFFGNLRADPANRGAF